MVAFTVQAVGTEPLGYLWRWKPVAGEHGSEEWQPCDVEKFSGAETSKLTILSVQKLNEGSYCCVIHNYAGSRTSKPAAITVGKNTNTYITLPNPYPLLLSVSIADPPRITTHPQTFNDTVPGKPVTFTVQATGTEPLTYQWQWKPAGEGSRMREWQQCNMESFPGADSSILTISSVQKLNEGSFRCAISNCVDSQTSNQATLSVGKILSVESFASYKVLT